MVSLTAFSWATTRNSCPLDLTFFNIKADGPKRSLISLMPLKSPFDLISSILIFDFPHLVHLIFLYERTP